MNKFIKPFACVMALTVPAMAAATVESNQLSVHEVKITYTNEDVATSYGLQELERQIRRAAEQVCGSPNQARGRVGSVRQVMENRRCYDNAVNEALQKIGSKATG